MRAKVKLFSLCKLFELVDLKGCFLQPFFMHKKNRLEFSTRFYTFDNIPLKYSQTFFLTINHNKETIIKLRFYTNSINGLISKSNCNLK